MKRDFTASAISDGICDGMVALNTPFAKKIGFTSDKFDGYLWRNGDRIMISLITSKQPHQGNLSRLIETIEAQGLRVAVPVPLTRMRTILEAKGFKMNYERFDNGLMGEVWEKPHSSD